MSHHRCKECGNRTRSEKICPECGSWKWAFVPVWELPVPWLRGDAA